MNQSLLVRQETTQLHLIENMLCLDKTLVKSSNAASTLVYIRTAEWDKMMCSAGKEDIPERARKRFEVRALFYLSSLFAAVLMTV